MQEHLTSEELFGVPFHKLTMPEKRYLKVARTPNIEREAFQITTYKNMKDGRV